MIRYLLFLAFFFFFFTHSSFSSLLCDFEVKHYGQHKMIPSPLDSGWVCIIATWQRSRVGSTRKGRYLCPVMLPSIQPQADSVPLQSAVLSIQAPSIIPVVPRFCFFQSNHLSSYGTALSLRLCPNILKQPLLNC